MVYSAGDEKEGQIKSPCSFGFGIEYRMYTFL
jgi:hypothetical protein